MRKRKHRRKQKVLAALLVLCIAAAGVFGLWEVSEIMAAGTRSGQPIAAFSVQDGVASYSLLGREGEISLAGVRAGLTDTFTSLPSTGRLLVWGGEAAGSLWQEVLLPLGERVLAPLLEQLSGT